MIKQQQHSDSSSMSKLWVEICLISARGLPRSSFLKNQWYAVGWTDPNNKYCSKIDTSGNPNPVWNTKFTTVIDSKESADQELALHVEVYSREPLFLREKLQGIASISLREFLVKYRKNSEGSKQGNVESGSFQLRKKNSDKPHGFIDISVKISEEQQATSSYSFLGEEEGFSLKYNNNGINIGAGAGPMPAHPGSQAEPPFQLPGNARPPAPYPYTHPVPYPRNYSNPSVGGPSYPPPPTPPSNNSYVPTFLPRAYDQSTMYMNMPSSGAGRGIGPGVGVGLGAGALAGAAAGAVMFGNDIMSGFQLPTGMRDASLTISTDSPI